MKINLETTFKQLHNENRISVRTLNALTDNAKLTDVKSLLDYLGYNYNGDIDFTPLLNIKNLGNKSYNEVVLLIKPYISKFNKGIEINLEEGDSMECVENHIDFDTTIEVLLRNKLISTASYTCFHKRGIKNLKSILAYLNFGKIQKEPDYSLQEDIKSIIEGFTYDKTALTKSLVDICVSLDDIFNIYMPDGLYLIVQHKICLYDLLQMHWHSVLKEYPDYEYFIIETLKTPLELHSLVCNRRVNSILEYVNKSIEATIDFRKIILDYLIRIVNDLKKSQNKSIKSFIELYETSTTEFSKNVDVVTPEMLFKTKMTDNHSSYLQRRYEELGERVLSVRAKKVIEKTFPRFEDVIPCFDKDSSFFTSNSLRGQGIKTTNNVIEFISLFKELFLNIIVKDEYEIRMNELEDFFPFLSGFQLDFVYNYWSQNKTYPCFYIAYNFIRLSESTDLYAYSLLFGFFDKQKRNLKEVAKILNISTERVRQLVTHLQNSRNISCLNLDDWGAYDNLKESIFLTENNDIVKQIRDNEKLNFDFNIFARILYIAFNFQVEEISNRIIAYNSSYLPDFRCNRSIKILEEIVNGKYAEDTFIPIRKTVEYLPIDQQEKANCIIRYIAKEVYNCDVNEEDAIILKKNFVDVSKELYEIISLVGEPISLDDLFEKFKLMYPTHRFIEPQSIKPYLYKHPSISPIGNSSMYALVEWDNVFFGSIRDMILDILNSSSEPVHIETIFDKVQENFPKTTFRSVLSTCRSIAIPFNEGYYGLENKDYSKDFIEKTTQRRYPFEERLRMYKDFVDTYHRFPTSSGAEQEFSLQRWLYNIQHDITEINDEQRRELEEMLASYENSGYPRNAIENEFLQKCNDFKEYVNNKYTLPAYNDGEELFFWMKRSKENFDSYTDQRRAYLTDLLNYLYSLGFCL